MAAQHDTEVAGPLSRSQLELIDGWWRAASYLSVGQIYLLDNPLLEQPLERAHIKPRLLGHWGTTPGLNFIYAHLNRLIKAGDLEIISYCAAPRDGPGPRPSTGSRPKAIGAPIRSRLATWKSPSTPAT
jgi:xylulose-5-phosphate/fructose-6-phosphate phosphoketolase